MRQQLYEEPDSLIELSSPLLRPSTLSVQPSTDASKPDFVTLLKMERSIGYHNLRKGMEKTRMRERGRKHGNLDRCTRLG